ncbi:hypothetical protein [Spirilliplanes yamanashiensis]|uniref:Lipoprotein n=1 Tax=Spirilliplanes yamanashiensis TaxID=42233 RepID=A0A8J3Y381_9ACTN|nr:hypothetical protein [Spirilliplanes yamanashiensis]MDP9814175.1 hypothetical protein [Spirilliplanes yamanashiensis]GIJ00843.1 hypothetical protein Sya03_01950 [Spirilliplanes yamanashiensis]
MSLVSRRRAPAALVLALLLAGCAPDAAHESCGRAGAADFGPPIRFAIAHDDYKARHVGRTAEGHQFFLTRPFEIGDGGREFVALYVFDAAGRLLSTEIDAFGPGDDGADRAHADRLAGLGAVRYGRIEVAPFGVRRFGTTFGLVARPPAGADDTWWVTAEPGDYMAFPAPWDCGWYDT